MAFEMAKVEHDGVVRFIIIAFKCHQHILLDFEFDICDFRVSLEDVSISREQFPDGLSHVNESHELCFEVGVFGY